MTDAVETWTQGAAFFPEDCTNTEEGVFTRIDGRVRGYLRQEEHGREGWMKDVVRPYVLLVELQEALLSGDATRELHALVVLMKSCTSVNVPSQRRVLEAIIARADGKGGAMGGLVQALSRPFDREVIERVLNEAAAGTDRLQGDDRVLWHLRAAGVMGYEATIPLLRVYAERGDSDVQVAVIESLSALRSFPARRALVEIAAHGKWPVSELAIGRLVSVAPEELRRMLRGGSLDRGRRQRILLALAWAGHRDPVGALCDELREMDEDTFREAVYALDRVSFNPRDEDVLRAAAGGLPAAMRVRIEELIKRHFP